MGILSQRYVVGSQSGTAWASAPVMTRHKGKAKPAPTDFVCAMCQKNKHCRCFSRKCACSTCKEAA